MGLPQENQQAAWPQGPLENDGKHFRVGRAELGPEESQKPSAWCRLSLGDAVSLSRTLSGTLTLPSLYKEQGGRWEQVAGPAPTFLRSQRAQKVTFHVKSGVWGTGSLKVSGWV